MKNGPQLRRGLNVMGPCPRSAQERDVFKLGCVKILLPQAGSQILLWGADSLHYLQIHFFSATAWLCCSSFAP